MSPELQRAADLYGNVAEEIKERLRFIELALALPVADTAIEYTAISDFSLLQFRKIFEAIALGCLVMNDHLPRANRLKKDTYRADKLIKALEKLAPEAFPIPCRVQKKPNGGIRTSLAVSGDWLKRDGLVRTYRRLDEELHVGTLSRRKMGSVPASRQSLGELLDHTRMLYQNHALIIRGGEFRLITQLNAEGVRPEITLHRRSPAANP